jgi:uncharacterized membrane protein YbaN (DUF454 family)
MNHKIFGKMVSDFYEKKVIATKTKVIAITLMWITLLISITFFMPFVWVKFVVVAIGVAVTIYIAGFPSK